MVENLPANAGDMGSEPWSRKIPHSAEQLSPCATREVLPGANILRLERTWCRLRPRRKVMGSSVSEG